MTTPNTIAQGQNYVFDTEVSGDDTLTGVFEVKKHPDDAPTISGGLVNNNGTFTGLLTPTQTLALSVGQWFIFTEFTDTDENISKPIKLYVSKGWT